MQFGLVWEGKRHGYYKRQLQQLYTASASVCVCVCVFWVLKKKIGSMFKCRFYGGVVSAFLTNVIVCKSWEEPPPRSPSPRSGRVWPHHWAHCLLHDCANIPTRKLKKIRWTMRQRQGKSHECMFPFYLNGLYRWDCMWWRFISLFSSFWEGNCDQGKVSLGFFCPNHNKLA